MAASRFIRRNTIVDLEIEGTTFTVDFGRDDIPVLIGVLAQRAERLSGMPLPAQNMGTKHLEEMQEESKKAYEQTINGILGDETASEKIFAEDQRMSFHSDVYEYLVTEYTRVISEPYAQYSPNRAQRRAGK